MRKILATILMFMVMAVMMPIAANAQTYAYKRVYRNGRYSYVKVYKKRSFYKRHRKVINTAGGTVGGAIIGGLLGGKKGAVIGGLAGAGGATIYNQKTKKKYRRY